ncbi:MAG: hypothetical protein M4579_002603 [Chaenotheca gracillima]|nr:MAG: hypothetical protein M4579_002603 [Chaenotheca gracillima]
MLSTYWHRATSAVTNACGSLYNPDVVPPSIPPSSPVVERPNSTAQTQSLLLTRLPIELRQRIYAHIVGHDKTYHLRPHFPRLDDGRVSTAMFIQYAVRPSQFHVIQRQPGNMTFDAPGPTFLSLLCTCHQIYIEASALAYGSNTFDLLEPGVLLRLAERNLRPPRLRLLRRLRLSWLIVAKSGISTLPHVHRSSEDPRYGSAVWEEFWDLVVRELNLLRLHVEVEFLGPENELSVESEWVKPMARVMSIPDLKVDIWRIFNDPYGDGYPRIRIERAKRLEGELEGIMRG